MFLEESPLSMDLWLRTFGLTSLTSIDINATSLDILVPPFDADSRRGTSLHSKSVLMLTLVGGSGLLQLPRVFVQCGLTVALALVMLLAICTDRSLYLLWICARKTGSNNYGGIVRTSFGTRAHYVTNGFLFCYLLLCLSNMMLTTRDIFTDLMHSHLGLKEASGNLVLFWGQVFLLPAYWQLTFYNLWPLVYVGIACSITSLLILLHLTNSHGATTGQRDLQLQQQQEQNWPQSMSDGISGLDTLLLHICASFNVLYIQSTLFRPTLRRMQHVVSHGLVGACLLLVGFGWTGYRLFQQAATTADEPLPSNFLRHASLQHSPLLKFFCGVCIYASMPLILIPCRDNILELIETCILDGQCPEFSDCQDEIETWTTRSTTNTGSYRSAAAMSQSHNQFVIVDETSYLLPSIEEDPRCELNLNPYAHYGSIFGILLAAGLGTLTNITQIIWKLFGASFGVGIAFILPAACYLEIHKRQTQGYKVFSRWLICISVVICFLCTVQAAWNIWMEMEKEHASP